MGHWRERLAAERAAGGKAVIWGAGSKGVSFLTNLGLATRSSTPSTSTPTRHGKFMAGTASRSWRPSSSLDYRPDLVVAMNPIYLDEIGAELARLGVDAELVAV